MLEAGSVVAKFKADITDLKSGITQAKAQVSSLSGHFDSASNGIKSFFNTAGTQAQAFTKTLGIVGAVAGTAFGVLGKMALDSASQFEQAEIGYTTLLGSAEKAKETLAAIQEDAKKTPFNLKDLVQANQLLISTGVTSDQSRKDIINLGNAISATGGGTAELQRLAVNLQQIKAVGQASALDIKQFAFAGINIYGLLQKSTGKTVEEIKNLASEGKIGYDDITTALAKASAAGGMFEGALDKQSKSLQGVFSNIQDVISLTMKDVLKESGAFDAIKNAAQRFLALIEQAKPAAIAFFKGIADRIREIRDSQGFQVFMAAMSALGAWIVANQDTILQFLKGLALAIGALIVFQTIAGIIALLTSPLALILGALALLYMAWTNNWGGMRDYLLIIWDSILKFMGYIKAQWDSWGKYLFAAIQSSLMAVWNIVKFIFFVVGNIIAAFILLFNGEWGALWELVKNATKKGGDMLINIFKNIWEAIKNSFLAFKNTFFGWFDDMWNKAKETADKIRHAISDAFDKDKRNSPSIMDRMKDMVGGVNNAMQGIIIPKFSADIAGNIGAMTAPLAFANNIEPGSSRNVTQNINATLSDKLDVDTFVERLAFKYRNEL